ncbi:putative transcriptional regulator, ArsR family (plasmid) [Azospirillum lipoferum 4B]|uniref:Transcriptional regulator, ArsR family n=2 Tax=Azospirillum lipoferum TaxID=193 RepID=G7ZA59_AZOL4|nr:putative transcriptional regulator, ArsR family [Azospirillum lipoferum 4B]
MPIADTEIADVARLLAILGEPSRLRIVRAVWERPQAVNRIVEATGLKQANVSKQLGCLVEAGILGRRRDGVSVIYFIALPLVRDLCRLVCAGVRQINDGKARMPPNEEVQRV